MPTIGRRARRFFFFNDAATTEIYTLPLHDALPIWRSAGTAAPAGNGAYRAPAQNGVLGGIEAVARHLAAVPGRKNIILISGKLFLPMTFKERLEFLRP